jgi:hypothetical protein
MKIKIMLTMLAILVAQVSMNAQAPSLTWDRIDGGSGPNNGMCVTKAPDGYIYVGGSFNGTIMFGSTPLTAPTTEYAGFIAKFRPDSTLVWAGVYGAGKFPNDIAVATDKSIYVTGTGVGVTNLYITKVDSMMNTIWEYTSSAGVNPGSGSWYPTNTGARIFLDHSGNVITCGTFTDSLAINGTALYAGSGSTNMGYMLKLDPAGNLLWAKPGKDRGDGFSIAVDQNDNVYYGYSYRDFSRPYVFSADVVKYTAGGSQTWLTTLDGVEGTAITTDNTNAPYIAAHLRDTAMLGTTSYTPNAYEEVALIKMDASTGNSLWIKNFAGTPGISGSNFITTAGYSSSLGVVLYAYGDITINGTPYSGDQLFSFDNNGNINWAISGPPASVVDMWVDQSDLYFAGYKSISSGNSDIYTARMNQAATRINSFTAKSGIEFYPNPSNGQVIIDPSGENSPVRIGIYNSCGQKVNELTVDKKTKVSLPLAPGIYFMQWNSQEGTFSRKLVIE